MITRETAPMIRSAVRNVRRHTFTGLSYAIPIVVVGGIFVALGEHVEERSVGASPLAELSGELGALALALSLPVLGAFIAYAVADRPGLAPGFVLSYAIQQPDLVALASDVIGIDGPGTGGRAGFIGVIVVGLLAGYTARWLGERSTPAAVRHLVPVFFVPTITTVVLLPAALVVAVPSAVVVATLVELLVRGDGPLFLVGALVGTMMAYDMGGPVNKLAYLFAVGLLIEGVYTVMAAAMVAGMSPPLGVAVAAYFSRSTSTAVSDRIADAAVKGLSFVTEGAIPFAEHDRKRVLPATVAGSAAAGAVTCWLAVSMPVAHGGVFAFPLSSDAGALVGCLAFGTIVTAVGVITLGPTFDPSDHGVTDA